MFRTTKYLQQEATSHLLIYLTTVMYLDSNDLKNAFSLIGNKAPLYLIKFSNEIKIVISINLIFRLVLTYNFFRNNLTHVAIIVSNELFVAGKIISSPGNKIPKF